MAERRMISKKIILTDNFTALSDKARLAYFYLITVADDDGFIGNLRMAMAMCRLTTKSVVPLIERGYIYWFRSGVAVIMHWRMQNKVAKDRYTPTIYTEEYKKLCVNDSGIYELRDGINR